MEGRSYTMHFDPNKGMYTHQEKIDVFSLKYESNTYIFCLFIYF